MMKSVDRVVGNGASAVEGDVRLDYSKMAWNIGIILIAIIFAPLTFNIEAFTLFLCLTYSSLLIGHSVGMHRLMIHRTFKCYQPVEKLLIYVGVLVGMSGPFGIIKIHDLRDWAQRQEKCHDFFSHKQNFIKDIWWQLTSKFVFSHPPSIHIESKYSDDLFYQFLEKTWRLQQVAVALFLYLIGGWSFVIWGVFVRVSVSIIAHWTITYFCHNPGPGKWRVKHAAVQASNIAGLGLLTYGECWHNNHHAFPESARIGLEAGQHDPSWQFIQLLNWFGLAFSVQLPRSKDEQEDIYIVNQPISDRV